MAITLKLALCTLMLAGLAVSGCGGTTAAPVAPAKSEAPAAQAVAVPFENYPLLRQNAEQAPSRTDHVRIKSEAELSAFLKAIDAERAPEAKVNFATHELLAFYEPGGKNGCEDHTLRKLTDTGSQIVPQYASEVELAPDADRMCTEVFIFPGYDLYAMPKSDKPVKGVKAP